MAEEIKGLEGDLGEQDLVKDFSEEADGKADEELTWEDAASDLAKQRAMIRQEVQKEPSKPKRSASSVSTANYESNDARQNSLDFILDLPLQLTVELGHTKMLIKDLLRLNQGAIIELTRPIDEPLEIMVNNKLVGRGEVVVVNDKFGVKLTDIMSPAERVEQLK